MRRIIRHSLFSGLQTPSIRFCYYKPKPEPQTQPFHLKDSLFNKKSFHQIINIIKNPDNPYPKNSAYFYAILECILDESNENSKIMLDHGDVIHVFLQEIMERIKIMGAKELSDILAVMRYRPKALRFDKELLITMHVRFQGRINELIEINQSHESIINEEQRLSMEDIKNQIEGLFYLKKNTTILNKVLTYSHSVVRSRLTNPPLNMSQQQIAKQKQVFYSIIEVINENLDDTIDPVRESIAEFISENYKNNTLPHNREILRMIVKCKFYKNYPIVRNQDWLHEYVYGYLKQTIAEEKTIDIEEFVSVLKSVTTYMMHIDPQSFQGFLFLIEQAYQTAKTNLLSISYLSDKQQLSREVNTISHQIKLIPSYLYLKNYYKINTISVENGNKVDNKYIGMVIDEIKPIIKKFVLCYFQKVESKQEGGKETIWLIDSIEENIQILNNVIKNQEEPEKLLLKSVENLLNTVTVFKDYNIINIDVEFSLLLIETEIIYCILCRQWISDEVRYLRLLEHSVFVIGELEREIIQGNPKIKAFEQRINRIKSKMQEELAIYDNMEKTYKQFTVLRLVAILKCMNMKPKYLGDFYRNVKMRKPNIYVETLSRTMLKVHNYGEVIDAFELMFQGKIVVKEIELGRIVFLSSKQAPLLKYWMHTNRKHFVSKICFCRRIINNIVSIIRMDNLQINRNSIQLLSEIVIENKLFEIENHSISNHQQSNQLKKILCNNFSILFRYSKMDSMIDDIFVVHKNIPTIFRNKFSHIEAMKILTFSAYLSEEQSIFYINRENKNALFKYVIMLMKKSPYCEKDKSHYLMGKSYNEQDIMLSVVDKIIEQYWPDNKLTNKGMPFYCEFLSYYTQVNKFDHLVKNENTIFLIIKEIVQDFRQVQNKAELKYIISRMENNYERLHFLSIFENETNINNTLENVISSMNFVMDLKIFGDFVKVCEDWIKKEIDDERKRRAETKDTTSVVNKEWKKHEVDKHLVNVMVVEKVESLDDAADYEILSLLTIGIMSHGVRQTINENMQLVMKRLIKINPISARLQAFSTQSGTTEPTKKKFPFELFKLVMSNLNVYLQAREKRQLSGKQIVSQEISTDKVCEWMIKCLLTYAREIENNEELEYIVKYLNNWNVDVLALIKSKFLEPKIELHNLCVNYFSVEILSVLWSQNAIRFNQENSQGQEQEDNNKVLSNMKIVSYIKTLLQQFEQTHLMNNYGVYFQQEGEKILNIIKTLLMNIIIEKGDDSLLSQNSSKLVFQVNHCLKHLKELTQEFTKISNRTFKYNKLRSGGKYAYLYNDDQGDVVDMLQKKSRNPFSNESPDISSKSLKQFSMFSEILQIMGLIKFSKWSIKHVSQQHLDLIRKINQTITKRQKSLLIDSQLTYFTDTQPLLQEKSFPQFGLKLYIKKATSDSKPSNKLTAFYLVNEKESMLYDFSYKKRRRLVGEEQLVVDYIESLVNGVRDREMENGEWVEGEQGQDKKIQIRVIPNHLAKAELKKILTAN